MLSVQPGLRGSNDLRVGRKMATFQLFFQSGRAKDLSAPLYIKIVLRVFNSEEFKFDEPHEKPAVGIRLLVAILALN